MSWLASPIDDRCQDGASFEALEPRVLLAVTFQFDYTLDANGFFDDQNRRDMLELAGTMLSSYLEDDLARIEQFDTNTWSARFTHPATGETNFSVPGLVVPQDTLIVYAGGRDLGAVLGRGGAGGWQAGGTQQWVDLVAARGELGALGPTDQRTDFGPWGGSITFNTEETWNFSKNQDDIETGESDFLSVALHELTHLVGFSSATDSFANLTSGSMFVGLRATQEYDDAGFPPLGPDGSHFAEGTMDEGLEVLMDPSVTVSTRKLLTRLDLAVLDDIGWQVTLPDKPDSGTEIVLSPLTGDGADAASISNGEMHVYEFTSAAGGRGFAQLSLPITSNGDLGIRVYDQADLLIASDDLGNAGATADVEFFVDGAGQGYTIEVLGLSGSNIDYTLEVDTEPVTHQKFYPEGFANNAISEFVSITNPNDFDVTFSITLRYEDPGLPVEESVVVMNRVVGAGLRNGETISDKGYLAPDLLNGGTIIKNTPYAIIVSSDGPLAVSMSHFDFSIATGESFTEITSDTWAFPRAERAPGEVNDFLVFYNPNDHVVSVVMSALVPGGPPIDLVQNVQPMRRSGWGFNFETSLPEGVYGVTVTSQAFDPNDQADHIGIVAALTHFDTVNNKGWGVLGDPTSGTNFGVLPSVERGATGDIEIAFMNIGNGPALVDLNGMFESGGTFSTALINVPNGGVVYRTGAQLGIPVGERLGLTYLEILNREVIVQVQETGFGDGTSTSATVEAGLEYVFGDAFINANKAGINYFETLSFFNLSSVAIDVTVEILFNDGVTEMVTVNVPGTSINGTDVQGGFAHLDLHELDEILNHAKLNFFGLRVTADEPFAVTLEHFDLFFGSGWEAIGAPIGITTPLDDLV